MESQLGKPHFLDGVVYAKDHAVAVVSDFVEELPEGAELFHPLYPETPGGEYYYQYVKRETKGKKLYTDYIPTSEFVHRSERGLWWMAEGVVGNEQVSTEQRVAQTEEKNQEWTADILGFFPLFSFFRLLHNSSVRFVPSAPCWTRKLKSSTSRMDSTIIS